ncbi:hypothetical protein [Azospirillum sp. sgz302134]
MSGIPKDVIESLRDDLARLPEAAATTFSVRAAVTELRAEIEAARRKGYPLEDILGLLAKKNAAFASVSLKTFRRYLTEAGKGKPAASQPRPPRGGAASSGATRRRATATDAPASSQTASVGAAPSPQHSSDHPATPRHAGLREDM